MKTYYKDGREVETVATSEHFVKFEDHFGISMNEAIRSEKYTYFYYLAWLTAETTVPFEEWVATTLDVDQRKPEAVAPFPPVIPPDGG